VCGEGEPLVVGLCCGPVRVSSPWCVFLAGRLWTGGASSCGGFCSGFWVGWLVCIGLPPGQLGQ
jgi:hypothetical protein